MAMCQRKGQSGKKDKDEMARLSKKNWALGKGRENLSEE